MLLRGAKALNVPQASHFSQAPHVSQVPQAPHVSHASHASQASHVSQALSTPNGLYCSYFGFFDHFAEFSDCIALIGLNPHQN
jgi:hypothetical protein